MIFIPSFVRTCQLTENLFLRDTLIRRIDTISLLLYLLHISSLSKVGGIALNIDSTWRQLEYVWVLINRWLN
jgi:hypothetical protein